MVYLSGGTLTTVKLPEFNEDRWELYHVAEDFSQANDLAAKDPEKLKALQEVFTKELLKTNALRRLPLCALPRRRATALEVHGWDRQLRDRLPRPRSGATA